MKSTSLNAISTVNIFLRKDEDVNVDERYEHALQVACAVKSVNIKLVAVLLAEVQRSTPRWNAMVLLFQAACARYDEVYHSKTKWYTTRSDKGGFYLLM